MLTNALFNRLLFLFLAYTSFAWGATFCHQINSYSEFEEYSMVIDHERFTKCVLDLQNNNLYYFNVLLYPMHLDFISKELLASPPTYEEYVENYNEVKPAFLFCSLIHHTKQNLWMFTLWEGDKATKEDITKAYNALTMSFYEPNQLSNRLYFRPTSTYQEVIAKSLVDIPIITNDELYQKSDYQPLHQSASVGILRIAKNFDSFSEDEIIVLPELINDITPVAGIITEQFSTPLSHLALRARAWDIPHAGIKDASVILQQFDGQCVSFVTTSTGYKIQPATAYELQEYQNRKKPPTVILKPANLAEKELKALTALKRVHNAAYGTKAANLGECTNSTLNIPQGFAIPFYYYNEHLHACGAYELIYQSHEPLENNLQVIRDKIAEHPIDKPLLEAATIQLKDKSVFVRSSTNAEDLAGFNGAGLYETVANVKTTKDLEKAIKAVWASVWSLKAYKERARYGIDQKAVYSAVLVQESIDATSAGVLVTKDIFTPDEYMEVYTINASRGLGINVVDGPKIPEQIVYNFDNKGIKVISRSSGNSIIVCDENGGTKVIDNPYNQEPVLTDEQVTTLGMNANRINRLFRAEYPLDIEWVFKDDTLYIVQVRPY